VGLTAKSGAGVVTRIMPLIVAMIFIIWLPFSPQLVVEYLDKPFRALGIITAIGGSIFFAIQMRHCPISFDTLKKLMPALILWSLATALGKMGVARVQGPDNILYYLIIQCVVVWFCYVVMMRFHIFERWVPHMQLESKLFEKQSILAGIVFGLVWILASGGRWLAIDGVENPAYVSVIGLTAPFLVMLIYSLIGRKENVNIWPGIGVVICSAVLVYFTSL